MGWLSRTASARYGRKLPGSTDAVSGGADSTTPRNGFSVAASCRSGTARLQEDANGG